MLELSGLKPWVDMDGGRIPLGDPHPPRDCVKEVQTALADGRKAQSGLALTG